MVYSLKKDSSTVIVGGVTVGDFLKINTYNLTQAQKERFDEVICHDKLIFLMEAIQKKYPTYKLGITDHGGYRPSTPIDLNGKVGGASGSMHKNGSAADIFLADKNGNRLDASEFAVSAEKIMFDLGLTGGVGVYAPRNTYIHIDTGVRKGWMAWFEVTSSNGINTQGGRPCVFKIGNCAAGVKLLQRYLNDHGYSCGTADGKFGQKTQSALKNYQKENGLTSDGIFGKNTNARMSLFEW